MATREPSDPLVIIPNVEKYTFRDVGARLGHGGRWAIMSASAADFDAVPTKVPLVRYMPASR